MRTFIAIELPQEIKTSLSKIQEELKKTGADVKWVEPKNIHLTLKFLGEVDQGKLDKVSGILEDLVKEKEYFYLRIISVGAFPRISSPRVIWVGIDKGDNETKVIAKELEQNLAKIGIPKENRPFSSHITIGRTRSSLNLQNLVEGLNILASVPPKENLEFNVTKIALCKSTLTPKGPIYEILKVVSLKTI